MKSITLYKFVDHLKPGDTKAVDKALIKKYTGLLPDSLLELWEHAGLDKDGNGVIGMVNPVKVLRELGCQILTFGAMRQFGPNH